MKRCLESGKNKNFLRVGFKTASVVLSNAFNVTALAVDTHVHRVANRLGLANSKNTMDTERQLTSQIPREEWSITHHRIIWHGRRVCSARSPKCNTCALLSVCKYGKNRIE